MSILKSLEAELLKVLEQIRLPSVGLKASKNKLALSTAKEKLGEIYVQHLNKADGYYAGMEIFTCEALTFCRNQAPPYESRLLNAYFLSKSSLSEDKKEFGDELGGIIRTPASNEVSATVSKITERLTKTYLTKAENCILGTLSLIDDVLAEPDTYAFPFLTILFAAQKHELSLDSQVLKKAFATKSIFGNKQFDLALANKLLAGG
ncbi:hypothetical protein [Pseudomonas sp. SMN5]|uniref:hypothetical protein n=1 Tax=Pseudomonas sp. SMN5 TaxID=3390198 RepID=UPI003F83A07C